MMLERFYNISKKYPHQNILRLTADCPLHDPDVIDEITSFFCKITSIMFQILFTELFLSA